MKPRTQRFTFLLSLGLIIAGGLVIALTSLNDHLLYFIVPSDVYKDDVFTPPPKNSLSLGGLVENGSVHRDEETHTLFFKVTDQHHTLEVRYQGLVPDLFREGQGVVAHGHFEGKMFVAREILAKHDENYMPREITEALKKRGYDMESHTG